MESTYVKYALALVSIAKEEKKEKEYKEALRSLLNLFVCNEDVSKFLNSRFVEDNEKFNVVDELCSSYKLDNLTNFVKLVVQKHLFFHFKDIVKEIIKSLNEELGIDEGFVYSTNELSNDRIGQIEDAISKKLNHKVELKNIIDSRLIGGIKVVVHDHVFDGSIKNKIDTMKQDLSERR